MEQMVKWWMATGYGRIIGMKVQKWEGRDMAVQATPWTTATITSMQASQWRCLTREYRVGVVTWLTTRESMCRLAVPSRARGSWQGICLTSICRVPTNLCLSSRIWWCKELSPRWRTGRMDSLMMGPCRWTGSISSNLIKEPYTTTTQICTRSRERFSILTSTYPSALDQSRRMMVRYLSPVVPRVRIRVVITLLSSKIMCLFSYQAWLMRERGIV